jgi:hypothetical protein
MDIKELEKWVETESGIKWLDGKKEGLIRKNEELIKELKTAGGSMSELTRRVTDMEKQLIDKQAAVQQALLDLPLQKLLKEHGVFDILIPQICRELKEVYDLDIKDMKAMGKLKNDTESQELPMGDIVEAYFKTESARQYVNPANTKVISTCIDVKGGDPPSKGIEGKTGIELARMSDTDFENAIQSMR